MPAVIATRMLFASGNDTRHAVRKRIGLFDGAAWIDITAFGVTPAKAGGMA